MRNRKRSKQKTCGRTQLKNYLHYINMEKYLKALDVFAQIKLAWDNGFKHRYLREVCGDVAYYINSADPLEPVKVALSDVDAIVYIGVQDDDVESPRLLMVMSHARADGKVVNARVLIDLMMFTATECFWDVIETSLIAMYNSVSNCKEDV